MISETAFDALRSTSLFAGFTEEQLEMVPKVGRVREFAAGDCVVQVGEEANPGLWLVLEGTARVEVEGELLRTIGAGGHFGEMALLTGEPRSADVLAQTDMVGLELTDRHLKALIGREPDVAIAMLAELARRLRTITADYGEMIREQGGTVDTHHDILGPIEFALRSGRLRPTRPRLLLGNDALLRTFKTISASY